MQKPRKEQGRKRKTKLPWDGQMTEQQLLAAAHHPNQAHFPFYSDGEPGTAKKPPRSTEHNRKRQSTNRTPQQPKPPQPTRCGARPQFAPMRRRTGTERAG